MTRKIIQICSGVYSDSPDEYLGSDVFALCNDGTVWNLVQGEKWRLLPEMPQDKPEYKKILDERISELRNKDINTGLSNNEKETFKKLMTERKHYELYREFY